MKEYVWQTKQDQKTPGARVVPGRSCLQLRDYRSSSVQRGSEFKNVSLEKGIPAQLKKNHTGLPDNLKSGIENLSGHSMDDVKVHYNSNKPAQLNAHAYAQGTDIHVASGQEKHLAHEAWHVVQQKQGRVRTTLQMRSTYLSDKRDNASSAEDDSFIQARFIPPVRRNVMMNDDPVLEREADDMGRRALQLKSDSLSHLKLATTRIESPVNQLMRRSGRKPKPKSKLKEVSERMVAGADKTSVLGGGAVGIGVGILAYMNSWNPLGWGLAAGLGIASALSYARGPKNQSKSFYHGFGLNPDSIEDEDSDSTWSPVSILNRHFQDAEIGITANPFEKISRDWDGSTIKFETGAGPATLKKGWGGQPFISTRATDFEGVKVGSDYDSMVSTLSKGSMTQQERYANIILRLIDGYQPDLSNIPAGIRRAMTHFIAITQVAEQHHKRTPGSAGLARACLRNIADGTATFQQEFNRKDGRYLAARIGGTGMMREVKAGTRDIDEDVSGNLSDDEN